MRAQIRRGSTPAGTPSTRRAARVQKQHPSDLAFYIARLQIAFWDTIEAQMGATSDLRQRVGRADLRVRFANNRKIITMADGTEVEVSATASHDQVADAMAKVDAATGVVKAPVKSGSFAASLKAMMDEARAGLEKARTDGQAQVKEAVGKLTEAKEATSKVAGNIAQTIKSEAADVMSELGQISNDL